MQAKRDPSAVAASLTHQPKFIDADEDATGEETIGGAARHSAMFYREEDILDYRSKREEKITAYDVHVTTHMQIKLVLPHMLIHFYFMNLELQPIEITSIKDSLYCKYSGISS